MKLPISYSACTCSGCRYVTFLSGKQLKEGTVSTYCSTMPTHPLSCIAVTVKIVVDRLYRRDLTSADRVTHGSRA